MLAKKIKKIILKSSLTWIHKHIQTQTLVFIEELAPFLSRLDFEVDFLTEEEEAVEEAFFTPVEGAAPLEEEALILRKEEDAVEQAFFPPDEDTAPLEEDDFILLISAIKALARFLTMTSRSGCFDLLPTGRRSRETEITISNKKQICPSSILILSMSQT